MCILTLFFFKNKTTTWDKATKSTPHNLTTRSRLPRNTTMKLSSHPIRNEATIITAPTTFFVVLIFGCYLLPTLAVAVVPFVAYGTAHGDAKLPDDVDDDYYGPFTLPTPMVFLDGGQETQYYVSSNGAITFEPTDSYDLPPVYDADSGRLIASAYGDLRTPLAGTGGVYHRALTASGSAMRSMWSDVLGSIPFTPTAALVMTIDNAPDYEGTGFVTVQTIILWNSVRTMLMFRVKSISATTLVFGGYVGPTGTYLMPPNNKLSWPTLSNVGVAGLYVVIPLTLTRQLTLSRRISPSETKSPGKPTLSMSESFSSSASESMTFSRTYATRTPSFTLSESFSLSASLSLTATETESLSDSFSLSASLSMTKTETESLSDSFSRSVSESMTSSRTDATRTPSFTLSESFSLSASDSMTLSGSMTSSNSMTLSDSKKTSSHTFLSNSSTIALTGTQATGSLSTTKSLTPTKHSISSPNESITQSHPRTVSPSESKTPGTPSSTPRSNSTSLIVTESRLSGSPSTSMSMTPVHSLSKWSFSISLSPSPTGTFHTFSRNVTVSYLSHTISWTTSPSTSPSASRTASPSMSHSMSHSQSFTTTLTNSATISVSRTATPSDTPTLRYSVTSTHFGTTSWSSSKSATPTATVSHVSPTLSISSMLTSSDGPYVSDGGYGWLTIAVPGVVGLAILFGVVVAVKHATAGVMTTTTSAAATAEAPPPPPSTWTAPF